MKLALIGYGKMGKAIEKIALEKGHTISHIITNTKDLQQLTKENLDIAVEFTQPESAAENIRYCLNKKVPVISGTTGWLNRYQQVLEVAKANDATFMYASNFSIGVALFFELNEWLASKTKKLGFHPLIKEIHHTDKKDSPSGTAITLAEGIIKKNPIFKNWIHQESTEPHQVSITSERKPNISGMHTVSYNSDLESIVVQHIAKDRRVFAQGVILAAEWIKDKTGIFTMSDFLNQQ